MEANALLPQLIRQFERLREIRLVAQDVREELADLEIRARSNGWDHADELRGLRSRLEEIYQEGRAVVEEITALGCDVKSVEEGLVDFPAMCGQRIVYLCWKFGENEICYWHELDAGFAGRRALNDGFTPASEA